MKGIFHDRPDEFWTLTLRACAAFCRERRVGFTFCETFPSKGDLQSLTVIYRSRAAGLKFVAAQPLWKKDINNGKGGREMRRVDNVVLLH